MDKWKELGERLKGVFVNITVLADGHEVLFHKSLSGERLIIETYVDGWIKGEWTEVDDQGQPEHPQGRFYRPMRKRLYPLKQYKALKRVFGKRKADEMTALLTVMVTPHWTSPRSLISHLKKHFPNLEIKADEVAS